MGVPVDETPPLQLPMLRGWFGGSGGFKELFQIVGHGQNIGDSVARYHCDFAEVLVGLPCPHNGKLSCFFAGISTFLSLSIASARAIRFLVECGMMTSSM